MTTVTTIKDQRTVPLHVTTSDNEVVVAKGARIASVMVVNADTYGIYDDVGQTGNSYVINGFIHASSTDLNATSGSHIAHFGTGLAIASNGFDVKIGKTGEIEGERGVYLSGSAGSFENRGTIHSFGTDRVGLGNFSMAALEVATSTSDIRNFGTITGFTAVLLSAVATIVNEKSGVISGYVDTIGSMVGGTTVINHGTIENVLGGNAIRQQVVNQTMTVVNDGTIIGDIQLSSVSDHYDGRGGRVKGHIYGGDGSDTYLVDGTRQKIVENLNEGLDTVRSTVTFTLPDNVETLVLLGKKNINGFGSSDADTDNYLYGNKGKNMLVGGDHFNRLDGGAGADMLVGGDVEDLFVLSKGYGRDTVKNYQPGVDQMEISGLGVASYQDVEPHIEKHGKDTWIDFGKDALILKNVKPSELDFTDFLLIA